MATHVITRGLRRHQRGIVATHVIMHDPRVYMRYKNETACRKLIHTYTFADALLFFMAFYAHVMHRCRLNTDYPISTHYMKQAIYKMVCFMC